MIMMMLMMYISLSFYGWPAVIRCRPIGVLVWLGRENIATDNSGRCRSKRRTASRSAVFSAFRYSMARRWWLASCRWWTN